MTLVYDVLDTMEADSTWTRDRDARQTDPRRPAQLMKSVRSRNGACLWGPSSDPRARTD